MNLQIIKTIFDKGIADDLISILDLNGLVQGVNLDIDLNGKILDVAKSWNRNDWQQELSSIIDVVAPIMNLVDIIGGEI